MASIDRETERLIAGAGFPMRTQNGQPEANAISRTVQMPREALLPLIKACQKRGAVASQGVTSGLPVSWAKSTASAITW